MIVGKLSTSKNGNTRFSRTAMIFNFREACLFGNAAIKIIAGCREKIVIRDQPQIYIYTNDDMEVILEKEEEEKKKKCDELRRNKDKGTKEEKENVER
jgi:hypothetical protein